MDKKSIGSGKPMLLTHLSIKQTLLFFDVLTYHKRVQSPLINLISNTMKNTII